MQFLEGVTVHYQPRSIHIIAPAKQVYELKQKSQDWHTAASILHEEKTFVNSTNLTKENICAELYLE